MKAEKVKNKKKFEMFGLNDDTKKFLDCLESDECHELLERNEMTIHIETGNIFFDNLKKVFMISLQDYDKVLLEMEFGFSADYDTYVSESAMALKNVNDDKYDMMTNRNSKSFLL